MERKRTTHDVKPKATGRAAGDNKGSVSQPRAESTYAKPVSAEKEVGMEPVSWLEFRLTILVLSRQQYPAIN